MADKAGKSMWLRFFREAGIPSGFDTKYALVFDENRIRKDMLMDIDKACLRDMGITAMGDMIAILKHAKQVNEEFKAQAYDIPQPSSTTVKLLSATASSTPNGNKNNSSPSTSTVSSSQGSVAVSPPPAKLRKVEPVIKTTTKSSSSVFPRLSQQGSPSTTSSTYSPSSSSVPQRSSSDRFEKSKYTTTASPVQRTTKSSVFPRLGSPLMISTTSSSSSSIGKQNQSMDRSDIRRTKFTSSESPSPEKLLAVKRLPAKPSIFSRLGQGKELPMSSTSEPVVVRRSIASSSSSAAVQQQQPKPLLDRSEFMKTNNKYASPSPEKMAVKRTSSVFSRLGQGSSSPSTVSSSSSSFSTVKQSPLSDRSDFMKTKFEVRQPIARTTQPIVRITQPIARTSPPLSASRQVVKEERYKNAAGKNMIRKTIVKTTVRKRI